MSMRRRASESARPPETEMENDPDLVNIKNIILFIFLKVEFWSKIIDDNPFFKFQDISLVRADSLDSLSSGGDSDGGPAEPTAAEISLLSASIGM